MLEKLILISRFAYTIPILRSKYLRAIALYYEYHAHVESHHMFTTTLSSLLKHQGFSKFSQYTPKFLHITTDYLDMTDVSAITGL